MEKRREELPANKICDVSIKVLSVNWYATVYLILRITVGEQQIRQWAWNITTVFEAAYVFVCYFTWTKVYIFLNDEPTSTFIHKRMVAAKLTRSIWDGLANISAIN